MYMFATAFHKTADHIIGMCLTNTSNKPDPQEYPLEE